MDKDWKEFEIAVADFLKAADPNNKVNHNVYLPDTHPRNEDKEICLRNYALWISS
jgi:hypothetical protein